MEHLEKALEVKSKEEDIVEKERQKYKRLWRGCKRPLGLSGSLALITLVRTVFASGLGARPGCCTRKGAEGHGG